MDPISAAIGGGFSLLSGLFGKSSSDKAAKMTAQSAAEDRRLQREFAQTGIQWKVADAKAAGIHPLAALGAQTHSYSPVNVGYTPDMSMANAMSNIGQDVSRAVHATRSRDHQAEAIAKTAADLQIKNMGLQNDLLAAQIAKTVQPGNPPGIPGASDPYLIAGQGQTALTRIEQAHGTASRTPLVQTNPMERTASNPNAKHQEPGAINEVGYTRTASGGFMPVQSDDAKNRLEEDLVGTILWNVRNRVMPAFTQNFSPPYPAPAGQQWYYGPSGEYSLRKKK